MDDDATFSVSTYAAKMEPRLNYLDLDTAALQPPRAPASNQGVKTEPNSQWAKVIARQDLDASAPDLRVLCLLCWLGRFYPGHSLWSRFVLLLRRNFR